MGHQQCEENESSSRCETGEKVGKWTRKVKHADNCKHLKNVTS